MTPSISQLVGDETLVALTYRQELAPIEGSGARIHPPTYPVPRPKNARKDEPRTRYDINEYGDGTRFCDLDTVQSQANRMEASYRGALADLIPRHAVEAGGHRVDLTELPHRLADASIRATALAGDIRVCFESFAAGDAVPLARLGPTSLVYGAWDSRDTRVSVKRFVGSRIEAHDVVECTVRCSTRPSSVRASLASATPNGARRRTRVSPQRSRTGVRAGSWCGAGSTSRLRSSSMCRGGTGRRTGARCSPGTSSDSRSGGSSPGGGGITFGPGAR